MALATQERHTMHELRTNNGLKQLKNDEKYILKQLQNSLFFIFLYKKNEKSELFGLKNMFVSNNIASVGTLGV